MGIVSGRIDLIYGLLLVIATQLTLVALGCAIKPDANGHVFIPNDFSLGSRAFTYCKTLRSVIFEEGRTYLPFGLFNQCTSLKKVILPNSLTSMGGEVFYNCKGLSNLTIGDRITTIGSRSGAPRVKYLTITSNRDQDIDTPQPLAWSKILTSWPVTNLKISSSITLIYDNAFKGFEKLESLEFELDDNSSAPLRLGSHAFIDACKLSTITIGRTVEFGTYSFNYTCMKSISSLYVKKGFVASYGNGGITTLFNRIRCTAPGGKCGCDKAGTGSNLPGNSPYYNCIDCVAGKYANAFEPTESCSLCPSDMYSRVVGASVCESCANLTTGSDGANVCGDYCPAGTYVDEDSVDCHKCAAGKYSDTIGVASCTPCPVGTTSVILGGASLESCLNCEPGKYNDVRGHTPCKSCEPGKHMPYYNATKCLVCEAGFHSIQEWGSNICLPCIAGKYQKAGMTKCDQCPDGLTVLAGHGRIQEDCYAKCDVGKASFNSKSSCSPCTPGTYNNETDRPICFQCTQGRYSNTFGRALCEKCTPGTYSDARGSPACTLCPGGKFGTSSEAFSASSCHFCPIGSYSFPGQTACRLAPPGSYIDMRGANDSTPCPAGKYQDKSNQTACDMSPAGRYSGVGSAVALKCPAGKYYAGVGGTDETFCQDCAIGNYSLTGASMCSLCEVGTQSPSVGASSCTKCEAGKASSIEGASSCITCEKGRYSSETGRGSCLLCGIGKYSDVPSSTVCSSCPDGESTVEEGSSSFASCKVTPCASGQYRHDNGTCRECNAGFYSANGLKCLPCDKGTYSLVGYSSCTLCPTGRYGTSSQSNGNLDDVCTLCPLGKFVNIHGSTACFNCTPGSSCGEMGMKASSPCPAGRYTDTGMQWNCTDCPSGRYQKSIGSARCEFCGAGSYNDQSGSNSSTACVSCVPGRYTSQSGFVKCTECAEGYYQPNSGASECNKNCKEDFDTTKTSNGDHTECIDDSNFLSESLIETLFDKGVAMYGACAIAAFFVAHAMVLQFKREKSEHPIGPLPRLLVVFTSFLPGFSFGAELFLIIGIFQEATALASTMLCFRLLHFFGGAIAAAALFGSPAVVERIESLFIKDATFLRNMRESGFFIENIPLFGLLVIMSLCDVTMFKFMPWKATRFFEESKGYPTLGLMKFCISIKIVQSLVSVVCQMLFIFLDADLDNPTTSPLAKGLFIANITVSIIGVIMGVVTFFMKEELLATVKERQKKDEEEEEQMGATRDFDPSVLATTENPMLAARRSSDSGALNAVATEGGLELGATGEVFCAVPETVNPMLATQSHVPQYRRETLQEESTAGVVTTDDVVRRPTLENQRLSSNCGEDNDNPGEATASPPPPPPPQSSRLPARPPAAAAEEMVRRLDGFAIISSKRNSLQRKARRKPGSIVLASAAPSDNSVNNDNGEDLEAAL